MWFRVSALLNQRKILSDVRTDGRLPLLFPGRPTQTQESERANKEKKPVSYNFNVRHVPSEYSFARARETVYNNEDE